MKYLDALNEMTDAQRALKNRIMGRTSRGQMLTPGKHSTGGSERGVEKVKGEKPKPSKHRKGRLLRTAKGPNPTKGHIAADDLVKDFTAGPQGKLPEHTEYKRMGLLMAESLGYRIDEFLPALFKVGSGIARGVGAAAKGAVNLAKGAGNLAKGAVTRKAKKKAMEKGQDVVDTATGQEDDQNQMEAYKQIGMAIAEVRMPAQHARDVGGSAEERKKNAAKRSERMGKVMRGKSIPPATASLAIDQGTSMSVAREQRRKAREKDRAEGPQGFGPDVLGAARKKIQARKEAEREARKSK